MEATIFRVNVPENTQHPVLLCWTYSTQKLNKLINENVVYPLYKNILFCKKCQEGQTNSFRNNEIESGNSRMVIWLIPDEKEAKKWIYARNSHSFRVWSAKVYQSSIINPATSAVHPDLTLSELKFNVFNQCSLTFSLVHKVENGNN